MHRDAGTLFQLFLRLAASSPPAAAAPSSATPAAAPATAEGTAPALLAERVRAAEYGVEQAEKACGADT